MGSVMDQERPWERDKKPEGATLRERIKDVLRDTNRMHETVEQIVVELERLEERLDALTVKPTITEAAPIGCVRHEWVDGFDWMGPTLTCSVCGKFQRD